MEVWIYPDQLGKNEVWCVVDDGDITWVDKYSVPENWKDIVTTNKGLDGKPSIHDIMESIENDTL